VKVFVSVAIDVFKNIFKTGDSMISKRGVGPTGGHVEIFLSFC
jgi:hypothetical protein